jgi:hypothetical protein
MARGLMLTLIFNMMFTVIPATLSKKVGPSRKKCSFSLPIKPSDKNGLSTKSKKIRAMFLLLIQVAKKRRNPTQRSLPVKDWLQWAF